MEGADAVNPTHALPQNIGFLTKMWLGLYFWELAIHAKLPDRGVMKTYPLTTVPPLGWSTCPVMYDALSDARNK